MRPGTVKDPSNIGNVLIDLGLLTLERLKEAVGAQMDPGTNGHLGEILLHMGAISPGDLEGALVVQGLLRKGDVLGAHLYVMDFQTRRMDRSLERSTAIVGALEKTVKCTGCPHDLPKCNDCPHKPPH